MERVEPKSSSTETETDPVERFKVYLSGQGLKYTKQREAIAEVFFGSEAHLSLTSLLDLAKARQPSVGYATVYRTMKLLAESGLATEHKFAEGNVLYEPALTGEHHDHLICLDCGRIVEYEDDEIERLQEDLARRHGFRVVSHRHEIYAQCMVQNCPERKRPQETDAGALKIIGTRSNT